MKHSVTVNVRIRPGGHSVCPTPGGRGVMANSTSFDFPTAVLQGSDQSEAKEALAGRLVRKFCEGGLSCTLMAYGQTGSGKTHTMFGPTGSLTETALKEANGRAPELWGVFPRVMLDLLEAPELSGASFHASAVEVYMEHAYDLLNARNAVKIGSVKGAGRGTVVAEDITKGPVAAGHAVIVGGLHPASCTCFKCHNSRRNGAKDGDRPNAPSHIKKAAAAAAGSSSSSGGGGGGGGGGVVRGREGATGVSSFSTRGKKPAAGAKGVEEAFGTEGEVLWPLQTPSDVARLTRLVESERVAHGHALNARSSRSHCLIRLHCTHVKLGKALKRTFLFVDLAGSERISKSEVTGARQKEASNINNSLTTLGRVVKEITEQKAYVSYRDSALTMLLRASFGGPSCTNVVINVSAEDEHSEETLCSLRFGEKLAGVETSAVAMKAVDVHHMRVQVADELGAAQARLREMKRAGLGDHINTSAPPSEQTSLRRNMDTLQEREVELRQLRARLVEAKASARGGDGATASALAEKLEGALFNRNNIRDIVERQQTIPGLWVAATPAFTRLEQQVTALEGQMDIFG